jgi:parallel beta-helix repeat protein
MKSKLIALSTLLILLISTIPFYFQAKPVEASVTGSSLIVNDAVDRIHAPRNAAAGSAVTVKGTVTNLGVTNQDDSDDSISGPAGLKAYYFDGSKGLLNPSDGNIWEMTVTNIDASLITGNKAFMFIVQDYGTGSGWESVIIQVHMNFYGAGGHLLQSFDNGWVLKSSHGFNPGDVPGKFDLRMLVQDLGPNYQVTPQFRLPGGVWQTFYDGSWTSANYELTKTRLAMQIDAGGGGTVTFDKPLAYSNGIWYADPNTTIQAAINAANSGQTIRAFNGVYPENLVVNKALTIKAASSPVIDGGAAGNCISVSANNVVISGFEIRNGYNGISGQTSGSTFSNNTIHDNLNIPGSAGVGILLWGDNDNNIITGNTIYDSDRQGIFIGYYDTTYISTGNIISYNTIHNNGLYRYANGPDASDYGIQLWTADNNVIEYNEIYGHDDWFPWGGTFDFAQGIYLCDSDSNLVTHNYLHSNNYGVGLWHPSRPVVTNTINYNNIAGNTGYGICTFDGPPAVDARFNWWGDASGPTHPSNVGGLGDRISGNVDYSPWLGFVVGTSPMTWHVSPTGGSDAIQEAIDEASDGDTIVAHPGTYYENQIIIYKSLTVISNSGASTTTIDGGSATLSVGGLVRINATTGDVTFSGFTLRNAGSISSGDRFGIYASSSMPGHTYTISYNKIYGTNNPDDAGDYGIYAAWGKEKLVFAYNLMTQHGSNPILIEVHTGETDVSYNDLDEGCYGSTVYFSMTHDGTDITTLQKVSHNMINVGTGVHVGNDYYGGGIVFRSAYAGLYGNGRYTNVQITDNAIYNMKGYRRAIELSNDALSDGSGGQISSSIIHGNSITGLGENQSMGIQLKGLSHAIVSTNQIDGVDKGINCLKGINGNHCPQAMISDNNITGCNTGISIADSATATVEYNDIRSNGEGIFIESDNNTIEHNRIVGNSGQFSGIHLASTADGNEIHHNCIVGNTGTNVYGVYKEGGSTVNATLNWWGDSTGPYHPTLNPSGLGNPVSNFVLFDPWLKAYFEYSPKNPMIGDPVTFNATLSTKPCNARTIVSYTWNFADGNITTTSNPVIVHAFASAGNCNVTLTQTYDDATTGTMWAVIHVAKVPYFKVDPQTVNVGLLNKTFTMDVTMNDLDVSERAVEVQYRLCYNATLLRVVNITEGSFMKQAGNTTFTSYVENDPILGPSVFVSISLLPDANGTWNRFPEGSGVLATITFKAIYQERGLQKPPLSCGLTLCQTLIVDDGRHAIPHSVQNGTFRMHPTNVGDLNYDGVVDIKDVALVSRAYGSSPGSLRWNSLCDIDGNNAIDIRDVAYVSKSFGWVPIYDP